VSGNEFLYGAGGGNPILAKTGVGIHACGTSYAGSFSDNVYVAHSLSMGAASTVYIESSTVNDEIIAKIVTPEVTLDDTTAALILAGCISQGSCSGL